MFASALALVCAGCSGVNTGATVSPMDFLLPGVGHLLKADPTMTNSPASFPQVSTELASSK
jgi:hypothetical protein